MFAIVTERSVLSCDYCLAYAQFHAVACNGGLWILDVHMKRSFTFMPRNDSALVSRRFDCRMFLETAFFPLQYRSSKIHVHIA